MRRLIVILLVACGAVGASAQGFPSDLWHLGELRLNNNTYIKGDIKYDLEHEAVQLERNGKIETYSAQQIASFKIVDAKTEVFRHFFTLPYTNRVGRKRPKFFEVIVEGKSTLLAREYVATVNTGPNNFDRRRLNNRVGNRIGNSRFTNQTNRNRLVLAHKMYVVNLDGKIRELTTKRKDLFHILKGHDDDLKKFIKKENLKLSKVKDMASIVGHFNSISTEQSRAN